MNLDENISTEELLNKERNFITKNSLLIMFLIVIFITVGLYQINVPIYENVKLSIVTNSTNQLRFYLKKTSNLKFNQGDTIKFIYENNKQISLVMLKNPDNIFYLFKIKKNSIEKNEGFKDKDAVFGKVILGKQNIIVSIFNNINGSN